MSTMETTVQTVFQINKTDEDGNTELHLAAYNCQEKIVKELVRLGANVNARNKNNETPLHAVAAAANDKNSTFINILKFLIENGGDVFAVEKESECTFLQFLLLVGSLTTPQFDDIVEFLVENNYSKLFNCPGRSTGQTPLMWSVHNLEASEGALSLLHKNGVDFTITDISGRGVLSFAIEGSRSVAVLSSLIELGAGWRHFDNQQRSLIHVAVIAGHVAALKLFIELGLDVNHRDSSGDTPLHLVVRWGNEEVLEIVRMLIQSGAEMKGNYEGETPLAIALGRGKMTEKDEIVELLVHAK